MPVCIVKDAPGKEAPRPPPSSRGSAECAGKSAVTIEPVLRNGHVLRVSEAINAAVGAPDSLTSVHEWATRPMACRIRLQAEC